MAYPTFMAVFLFSPVNMKEEASRIEKEYKGKFKPRSVNPSFTDFLALIGRLLFYRPTGTEDTRNVRFIYVHFSAWHFAGSDKLWAGLVIRLFEAIQLSFGKLQFVLYRVAQHDEEEEVMEPVCELSLCFFIKHSQTRDSVGWS